MAITNYLGKTDRNLQEQVIYLTGKYEYLEKQLEEAKTLLGFDIRVIDVVDTWVEPIDEGNFQFGDTILVGPEGGPYTFYIYTRGNPDPYWLNFGRIGIVGPEGPQGEQGPQGEPGTSTRWYMGANPPTGEINEGDAWLSLGQVAGRANGNVYLFTNGEWTLYGNLQGPQGVQGLQGIQGVRGPTGERGEQGPQGDPGGFIKIWGIVPTVDDLLAPTVLQDLEVAYLVGEESPYTLYIQVGTTYETAFWMNMGSLNTATYVQSRGQFVGMWDADTKLDKITTPTDRNQVYMKEADGVNSLVDVGIDPGDIVGRLDNQSIWVPEPEDNYDAANKLYVDELIQDSDTILTAWQGPDLTLNLSDDLKDKIDKSVQPPSSTTPSKRVLVVPKNSQAPQWQAMVNAISYGQVNSIPANQDIHNFNISNTVWYLDTYTATGTAGASLSINSSTTGAKTYNNVMRLDIHPYTKTAGILTIYLSTSTTPVITLLAQGITSLSFAQATYRFRRVYYTGQ